MLQSFGYTPKITDQEKSINLLGKCKNFNVCKGEGNSNRYTNLKNHRKEKYCPLKAKVNLEFLLKFFKRNKLPHLV